MNKCFKDCEVNMRIEQIPKADIKDDENDEIGYWETFTNPAVRGMAWVGFNLAAIQAFSGISAITFYSSQMFNNSKTFTPNQGSALLLSCNALCYIPATYVMGFVGRRTLVLWT